MNGSNSSRIEKPRRVVTGVGPNGLSCVLADGPAPASLEVAGPGSAVFHNLWRTDAEAKPAGGDGQDPAATLSEMTQIFPGPGGSHFTISIWPPQFPPADTLDLWMHRTDTVDYILILSGQITCFFDGGDQTILNAGDVLIQNGAAHAWRNEGETPCAMAAVAIASQSQARPQIDPGSE